jgi:hypothetical protein
MAHFLKLKAQYPHMHILTQSTQMNKMNGNCVGAREASSNPLLNMLEPTYVLYPFVRLQEVDDPTDLLGISKKKEPRGGIIFSAASANEVTLPASNLPSRVASPSVYIQKGGRSAVAYLPNTKKEDADINRMYAPIRCRFYGEGKMVLLPTEVQRFFVQPSPAEVAQAATGGDTTLFQATPEQYLTLDNVTYTRVPLDGRVYAFRAPGAGGVMEDWKGGRFTDDEAKFLNQLQLRTNTLEKIFPEEETQMKPMERVAEFLRVMVMGRCFTDERLLTATECQNSRDFVNRVYTYYLMHNETMEELKDAEEEVRKRSARLRLETAEERMQAAQRAERQRAAELDAELQKIRDNAKEIGVDLVRESSDFLKNPVGPDGPVREATKVGLMRPPNQVTGDKNKHTLQVIVFKRKASTDEKTGHSYIDYWTGNIEFTVGEGEDLMIRTQQELEKLNRDYPGYYFVQDFD